MIFLKCATDALTEPARELGPERPDGNSYYAYYEVWLTIGDGWDLNGDGDTEDFLKVVREKDIFHPLEVD